MEEKARHIKHTSSAYVTHQTWCFAFTFRFYPQKSLKLFKMMNCVKLNLGGRSVVYTTHEIPRVENSQEIVVRVVIAGVCGTDLHIIENKFDAKDGIILGHEIAGVVHETPDKCDKFRVGDRVVLNPNINCGQCHQCKKGLYNFCEEAGPAYTLGIWTNGGWAEYCKAHISLVYKIPNDITFEQAVLCEPLSCIVHGLDRLPNINIGSQILVIGAGIIGLLWCSILHLLGHRRVTVSEPNVDRQKTLQKLDLGFKCTSWDKILENKDPKWKVDLCIDCSGNSGAIQAAIPLLQCGSVLLIFGVADPVKKIEVFPFELYKKEITMMGTAINTHTSFHKAVALMESFSHKYITMERLAMKKHSLKDYEDALNNFKKATYSKIIFEV